MSGRFARASLPLAGLLLVGACVPAPAPGPGAGPTVVLPTAAPSAGPTLAPAVSLVGTVLAPEGVLAAGALELGRLGAVRPPTAYGLRALAQRPLGGVQVQAFDAAGQVLGEPALTGPDGRFRLPPLPAGTACVVRAGVRTAQGLAALEALARVDEGGEHQVDLATTAVTARALLQLGVAPEAVRGPAFARAALAVRRGLEAGWVAWLTEPTRLAAGVRRLEGADQDLALAMRELATPVPSPQPPQVALTLPLPRITALPSPTPTPTPRPTWTPWAQRTPVPLAGIAGWGRLRTVVTPGAATLQGLAFTPGGTLYVADAERHALRRLTPDARLEDLVGGPEAGDAAPLAGPDDARFRTPVDVVALDANTLVVADRDNHVLRRVQLEDGGVVAVTVLAGDGQAGFFEGRGAEARLGSPGALAFDGRHTVFVADGPRVLAVDVETGEVAAHAGGEAGVADGDAAQARFRRPVGLAARWLGERREVWVADAEAGNLRCIREVPGEPGARVTTPVGPVEPGALGADPRVAGLADALPLDRVRFRGPGRLAFGPAGDLFVCDPGNDVVRWVRFEAEAPVEVRTLGLGAGRGGPVEAVGLLGLAVHPTEGRLWVTQAGPARLAVFE
ncbi:MAG: hypothetical protein VKQ33_06655 [Candidatus Sericytochromatia bacterium]|nr:hypothetical protein [Candidatus Sericytochromatia bacterium]